MRTLITIPLTLVFVAAFVLFFLFDSVARYTADPDAFIETAREAKVRETIVDVTEEFIYDYLRQDPSLQNVSRTELRALVEGVISDEWFHASVRSAHAAALAAIDEAKKSAIIDLRATKQALRDAVQQLQRRAGDACATLMGADACADADHAARLLAVFGARANRAIDGINDEIDILGELTGAQGRADSKELELVRKRLGDVRSWRWIGLGTLIVCLLLIALVNGSRLTRMLRATGLAVVLGAGLFLATAGAISAYASDEMQEHVTSARDRHAGVDRLDRMIAEGSERFTLKVVEHSMDQSTGRVLMLGLVGLGAFLTGALLRR